MMDVLFDLTGKVAAVTGANTGLGQAMSLALARAGASVALIGRSMPDQTAAMIDAFNGKHAVIMADLSQQNQLSRQSIAPKRNWPD